VTGPAEECERVGVGEGTHTDQFDARSRRVRSRSRLNMGNVCVAEEHSGQMRGFWSSEQAAEDDLGEVLVRRDGLPMDRGPARVAGTGNVALIASDTRLTPLPPCADRRVHDPKAELA
jgi:hypothetical protein